MIRRILSRFGYIHKDTIVKLADGYTGRAYELGWSECNKFHTSYAEMVRESKVIEFPGLS